MKIKKSINRMIQGVEDNDSDAIMIFIAPDYQDDHDRTYEDISSLIKTYLNRFKGIVVNLLDLETIDSSPTGASIRVEVSFSHGAAQALRKMLKMSIRFYSIEARMVRNGDTWQILSADWRPKESGELTPEAMEVLKELFPNVF